MQALDIARHVYDPTNVAHVDALLKFVSELFFVEGVSVSQYAMSPSTIVEALHGIVNWAAYYSRQRQQQQQQQQQLSW